MADENDQDAGTGDSNPQVEAEARAQGWVSKEEYNGPEDKWIDAAAFLDRAQNILPIVKASNRKLQDQVGGLQGQLRQLETQLRAANESIAVLKQVHDQQSVNDAKDARRDLQIQRSKAAREENDELVAELDDKIKDLDDSIREGEKSVKEAKTKKTETPASKSDTPANQTPEYKAWCADNPWWGTDTKRSNYAATALNSMIQEGKTEGKSQREVLDMVTAEVEEVFGPAGGQQQQRQQQQRQSKTGGGMTPSDTGGGNGSRRGKSYNDLPDEAKRFCQKTAGQVVGKGRAFENIEAYQKHYAREYFKQNPEG